MAYKYTFTVFTPVFNRKDKIHRVWDSLQKQSFNDFEWVVVDDGSTDGIQGVLDKYQKEAHFPMKVLYQGENLGKHFAWNRAAKEAQGKFFVPADSDDSFLPNTLERFLALWEGIEEDKQQFSGVNVLCQDPHTKEVVGDHFPESPLISDNLELGYKYQLQGEKWGMIRTDLIKEYLFPELRTKRGSFIMSYLWFLLAHKGYKTICYNEVLRNYYTDDGQSIVKGEKAKTKLSADVKYYYLNWNLSTNFSYISRHAKSKAIFKTFINLFRNGLLDHKNCLQIILNLKGVRQRAIASLIAFPAWFLYLFTYKKYHKA